MNLRCFDLAQRHKRDRGVAAGFTRQRGAIMTNSFRREAARCKSEARRFAGKAEEPFLLRLSEAFEDLAYREKARSLTWGSGHDPATKQTVSASTSPSSSAAQREVRTTRSEMA